MIAMQGKSDANGVHGTAALVVGGSGGLGLAVARRLCGAGARLTIHGKDQERLDAAVRACCHGAAPETRPETIRADLGGGSVPDELLEAASACDILVLAYGPFLHATLEQTGDDDWQRMCWANLALPGMLAGRAARAMAARGFGRILFFGGTRTDAIRGFRMNAAYAAAKTGLGVLAKSLAAEYSGRGVSCALLCPGFVDTEYLDQASRAELAAKAPRGRLIRPEAIAELAVALLSGGMDLANGSIIVADEGLYAL
ncbi:MAG: SDR family oxidoreductase [Spirochaetia bacterium]|nr:SDR family oxidoreductase [Spirochaetia bacterium]